MKKLFYSAILIVTVGVAFLAGSWSAWRTAADSSTVTVRKILYYVDPMHPSYKSDKPGIAPDCGMDLEPAYADDRGTNVRPPADGQKSPVGSDTLSVPGVRVSTVRSAEGSYPLRMLGRVAADETRTYRVTAGIEGFIREVAPLTTGSQVKKNQLLATFASPNAINAIQQYILLLAGTDRIKQAITERSVEAQAAPLAAANMRQRIDQLENLGMSPVQMEEIKQTRDVPASIKILAPADGLVFSRNVSPNMKFDRGQELYRIVDLRRVWIVADVIGRDAQEVRPGMEARLTLPDDNRTFVARVSDVLPQFNPDTRTRTIRLEADNPGAVLRPDMFVDVQLTATFAAAIVVPADAIIDTGLRKTVFVERAPNSYEPREVQTGWRRDGRVEITQGLSSGDRVVTSGVFLVDSESRIGPSSVHVP